MLNLISSSSENNDAAMSGKVFEAPDGACPKNWTTTAASSRTACMKDGCIKPRLPLAGNISKQLPYFQCHTLGQLISNREPPRFVDRQFACPPCACAIAATTASPSPLPPLLRERDGSPRRNASKIQAATSSLMPGPSSSTLRTHTLSERYSRTVSRRGSAGYWASSNSVIRACRIRTRSQQT